MRPLQKKNKISIVLLLFTCFILLSVSPNGAQAEQDDNVMLDEVLKGDKESVSDTDAESKEKKTESKQTTPSNQLTTEDNAVGLRAGDYFKMIFALLFVVALLYGLLQFINKKNKVYQHGKMIENMGGASLGSNRSVQMVRVGEKILVLGVAENIQLLNIVEEEAEFNAIIDDYNNRMEQALDPKDIVTKLIGKWQEKTKPKQQTSFSATLKEELSSMSLERKKWMEDMKKKGNDSDE